MTESHSKTKNPKAVIHKKILDVAESNPDASIEGIADEISGASPALVERVLDDYGDPAESQPSPTEVTSEPSSAASDGGQTGFSEELDKQFTTLHERIDQIEQRIDEASDSTNGSPFSDPDLAAKIVRACMNDESITEDEEITILSELLE
ncbi:MAG: hypothetical protein SVG88_10710 [Halobacteriales archaeon]|nr:hypothetical protein [Halobacteriales archaeon]